MSVGTRDDSWLGALSRAQSAKDRAEAAAIEASIGELLERNRAAAKAKASAPTETPATEPTTPPATPAPPPASRRREAPKVRPVRQQARRA